jgi:hypothetical protein
MSQRTPAAGRLVEMGVIAVARGFVLSENGSLSGWALDKRLVVVIDHIITQVRMR